jgi:hypothetical protein
MGWIGHLVRIDNGKVVKKSGGNKKKGKSKIQMVERR